MTCALCNEIKQGKNKIYEDEHIYAVIHPKPASPGHMVVFPKKHYQILEQVPDFEVAKLFDVANKLSTAVFESLKVHGTNIIVQNGLAAGQSIPHISLHIIPRMENDGINFQWEPRQLNEEEMSTVELTLKDASDSVGGFEKEEKKEPVKVEKKIKKIKTSKQENYLIKQLERIP